MKKAGGRWSAENKKKWYYIFKWVFTCPIYLFLFFPHHHHQHHHHLVMLFFFIYLLGPKQVHVSVYFVAHLILFTHFCFILFLKIPFLPITKWDYLNLCMFIFTYNFFLASLWMFFIYLLFCWMTIFMWCLNLSECT